MSRIFATFDGFCEQIVSRSIDVTCYFYSYRLGKRCMLGSGLLMCFSTFWSAVRKGGLIWIILPLVVFQSGVVYMSPRPRQIRMESYDVKHLTFASGAVRKDAGKSELSYSTSYSLMIEWRSAQFRAYFQRPRGIIMHNWLVIQYVFELCRGSLLHLKVNLLCNCFVRYLSQILGLKQQQVSQLQRLEELQIARCCTCILAYCSY